MKGNRKPRLVYLALLAVLTCMQPGCALGGSEESHIDANVPAKADFDRILRRDLEEDKEAHVSSSV